MAEDTYIGIDPGASGATVILRPFGEPELVRHDSTPHLFCSRLTWVINCFAIVENVHSMPREGVSSAFKFGKDFGLRLGILTALGVPYELVTPTTWQRAMGIQKKKGETNTQKKNRHKAKAEQLFPSVTVTHRNADALLIAEYCRRTRQGVTA